MKKVTVNVPNMNPGNAGQISEALNALSGVVAADAAVPEGRVFAYAGDKLSHQALLGALRGAGYQGTVEREEFFEDTNGANRAMTETEQEPPWRG